MDGLAKKHRRVTSSRIKSSPSGAMILENDAVLFPPKGYPPYMDYGVDWDADDSVQPSNPAWRVSVPSARSIMQELMKADAIRRENSRSNEPSAERPEPPSPIQMERRQLDEPPPQPRAPMPLDLPRLDRDNAVENIAHRAELAALPAPRRNAIAPNAAMAAALWAEKKRQDDARMVDNRLLASAAYINALKPYAHYRVFPSPARFGLGLTMQGHADFAQNLQNAIGAWGAMNQAMLEAQNRRREAMAAPAATALRTAALLDALGGKGNFAATMQRLFG